MAGGDLAERVERLEMENERLRRRLDKQGVPVALRHQARNALSLMRAILRRSAESKTSVEDFVAHLEGRLDALLRVQAMLISSPDGGADLHALVSNELLALTIQDGGRAAISGPSVRLASRAAELLGLVLHELVTNALKFGALTVPAGRIAVSWTVTAVPERLELLWAESGRGRTDAAPTFRGFGMEAIECMLPYQLKAESRLEFLPEGLRCAVVLPLS